MRKFFGHLLQFLPLMIGLVATNYFVDPANLFHGTLENSITDYLVKGFNVTNVTNYNERVLQRYFIEKSDQCPSTIAIGASRIMTLGQSATGDANFRNNGLSSASLEDYLGIVELYEEKGCKLDKVIVDIEPYLLNDAHGQEGWISLDREFNAMRQKISSGNEVSAVTSFKIKTKRYLEIFSPSYFKNSIDFIMRAQGKECVPTHEMFNTGRTIITDGSFTYGFDESAVAPEVVEEKVRALIASNQIHGMANFYGLSPRYSDMFEKFIDHLQQRHIKVEFRLFPYPPSLYNFFERTEYYHVVLAAERYFKEVAARKGIPVFGSYDPKASAVTNSSFQDAYHLKRVELERLYRE